VPLLLVRRDPGTERQSRAGKERLESSWTETPEPSVFNDPADQLVSRLQLGDAQCLSGEKANRLSRGEPRISGGFGR
jgi:hypothetical protein